MGNKFCILNPHQFLRCLIPEGDFFDEFSAACCFECLCKLTASKFNGSRSQIRVHGIATYVSLFLGSAAEFNFQDGQPQSHVLLPGGDHLFQTISVSSDSSTWQISIMVPDNTIHEQSRVGWYIRAASYTAVLMGILN